MVVCRFFSGVTALVLQWARNQGQTITLHADDGFTVKKGDVSFIFEAAGTTNLSELVVVNVGPHHSDWCGQGQ